MKMQPGKVFCEVCGRYVRPDIFGLCPICEMPIRYDEPTDLDTGIEDWDDFEVEK